MADRMEAVAYELDEGVPVKTELFFDGPGEFLVRKIADHLRASPVWSQIFGSAIEHYRREDFSFRDLPALRIYNEIANKEFDSWFIDGEIKADIAFPASLRREETQQIQDTVTSALLQEFRRPDAFQTLLSEVPGLNELGRRFNANKALGLAIADDAIVPLTQITLNFRIDLREWDNYLQSTDRTKDSPFSPVLGDLTRLVAAIKAVKDDGAEELELKTDQEPGEEVEILV